jgi:DNA repair exonuclease SbcCD ATPase subunit
MHKLSKIELENFRVFKGYNPFEFINRTGEPYNFICIYGPNGTGKTSLVDALEWLATGKLHRIDSDMQVQGKTYEGAILTNSEAYISRQWANVTAHFKDSNVEYSQRRSVRPRIDSANDYLSGSCTGRGLSSVQILPNSKVAGFVSAEKPEQRFTSWTEFVNPKDQSFTLMANTYRLRSKIKSVLDNTEAKLREIKAALSKCSLDAKLILILNDAISSYNEDYRTIFPNEKSIALLRQNDSGIYQIPDLSAIKALQLRVAGELERLRTREPIFKQLINGYHKFQKAIDDLADINKTERIYQEKIENIQHKNEFITLTRNLDALYEALTHRLIECINDTKEQISQSTAHKSKFEKEQQIWRQQLEQIEHEIGNLKASNPNPAYQEAVERQEILKISLESLTKISNAIKSRKFEVASTHAVALPEKYRPKVVEVIRQLAVQDSIIQSTTEQRAQISQRIQEAESSCNEIVASIEQIRALIMNAQLNVCPVCQTEFASTDLLLARIKQEFCSKDLAEARADYYAKEVLLKSFHDSYRWLSR